MDFLKKLPADIHKRALKKLVMINLYKNLLDFKTPPKNCFEALKGDRQGQYSIRINDQWRICFKWFDSHAFDVEIVDYH